MTHPTSRDGFSLLELMVVTVIIGLVIGGITAGTSLIRGAEIKQYGVAATHYSNALHQFVDEFHALPGDMDKAEDYWGSGTCPGTSSQPSTGLATCDGNGNGQIEYGTQEQLRAWQHMANAQLVEGKYTGVSYSAGGTFNARPGLNVPKVLDGGVSIRDVGYQATDGGDYFSGDYGHILVIGGETNDENDTREQILSPTDVKSLDEKYDDGSVNSGSLRGFLNDADCHNSGNYALDEKRDDVCAFLYITGVPLYD